MLIPVGNTMRMLGESWMMLEQYLVPASLPIHMSTSNRSRGHCRMLSSLKI